MTDPLEKLLNDIENASAFHMYALNVSSCESLPKWVISVLGTTGFVLTVLPLSGMIVLLCLKRRLNR